MSHSWWAAQWYIHGLQNTVATLEVISNHITILISVCIVVINLATPYLGIYVCLCQRSSWLFHSDHAKVSSEITCGWFTGCWGLRQVYALKLKAACISRQTKNWTNYCDSPSYSHVGEFFLVSSETRIYWTTQQNVYMQWKIYHEVYVHTDDTVQHHWL